MENRRFTWWVLFRLCTILYWNWWISYDFRAKCLPIRGALWLIWKKNRFFMGLYIRSTTPFVCRMSLGGTFGSANIHSPRYERSCYGSITITIHHPYLKIHRLGSAEAISYLFEGQQNGKRLKIRTFRQKWTSFYIFGAFRHRREKALSGNLWLQPSHNVLIMCGEPATVIYRRIFKLFLALQLFWSEFR